jgi:hypothetical protein
MNAREKTRNQIKVDDNIYIIIDKISDSLAMIYFVNQNKRQIKIPENFEIIEKKSKKENIQQNLTYCLSWNTEYEFIYNKRNIFEESTIQQLILR